MRRGMSFTEFLVVLLIVGVLLFCLVPAANKLTHTLETRPAVVLSPKMTLTDVQKEGIKRLEAKPSTVKVYPVKFNIGEWSRVLRTSVPIVLKYDNESIITIDKYSITLTDNGWHIETSDGMTVLLSVTTSEKMGGLIYIGDKVYAVESFGDIHFISQIDQTKFDERRHPPALGIPK